MGQIQISLSNTQGQTAIHAALSAITMTTGEIKSMKAANTTVSVTYEHHLKSIKLLIDQNSRWIYNSYDSQ